MGWRPSVPARRPPRPAASSRLDRHAAVSRARARRWLCRPGRWRSSPRLGHTQPPLREEAMDDDNGNPAPAAELAPNRNVQRSPAPPSQALANAASGRRQGRLRPRRAVDRTTAEHGQGAGAARRAVCVSLGLSGAADRNWSAERCPSVGVCLQPPSFQVFSASAVVGFGPWSLDSRVDVCGSPRGFRHRTEAVVHRALLSRRAQAEFDGLLRIPRPTNERDPDPSSGFGGFRRTRVFRDQCTVFGRPCTVLRVRADAGRDRSCWRFSCG